jgi:hypothetical protein
MLTGRNVDGINTPSAIASHPCSLSQNAARHKLGKRFCLFGAYLGIIELARCVGIGLYIGFRVSGSMHATGTVPWLLRVRCCAAHTAHRRSTFHFRTRDVLATSPSTSCRLQRHGDAERVVGGKRQPWMQDGLVTCIGCTALDPAFPNTLVNGSHFIRPVWGGVNEHPIRTSRTCRCSRS